MKDNHIIVTYEKAGEDFLYVAIIKQTNSGLKWIKNSDAITFPINRIAAEGTPIVTIVRPRDEDYKAVKVFGKPAKSVTYYKDVSDKVTLEFKYWIAYTDKNPDSTAGDIELIKE
ncbi:hypothetical protein E3U55_17170 [Filobacillus milosensis]|uniref:Uncharacterized protein n=1 Tax=Filobacillus milosensis TaxID=94137 RepID=A0A4Y8IC39_9BACI|nr:hypothetical protein E3U55_17170 [Filobacillus milosensis]